MKYLLGVIMLIVPLFAGCSKDSMSERDAKKQQQQSNADIKRKELSKVAGIYEGAFTGAPSVKLNYSLKLEIKDIPTTVDGQVDPVLIPILTGYLRFYFSNTEFVSFSVQKAEFELKAAKLNLILFNEIYKEIYLTSILKGSVLEGSWTAPSLAISGNTILERKEVEVAILVSTALSKVYQGNVLNTNPDSNLPEKIQLSFVTSQDPAEPSNIKVTGSMRLYYGPFGSVEYQEFPFSEIQYNFFTKKLVAKTDGSYKLTIKADIEQKTLSGKIYSDALGEMATFEVNKNE